MQNAGGTLIAVPMDAAELDWFARDALAYAILHGGLELVGIEVPDPSTEDVRIELRPHLTIVVPVRRGNAVRFQYRDAGGERWVEPSPVEVLSADEIERAASRPRSPSVTDFARDQVAAEVLLGAQLAFIESPEAEDHIVRVLVQPGRALAVPLRPGPSLRAVLNFGDRAAVSRPSGPSDR
jgi:hypothetical protein